MDTVWYDFFRCVCFWAAFCSWMLAQTTKMVCGLVRTGRIDFSYVHSTGGMPSAHSAMVSGLATSLGMSEGFCSPVFALSLGFAILTMFDASTVRRAAGLQAQLLNQIVDELFRGHHLSKHKLAELLGHTRLEVFMGMVMGILTAVLVFSLWTISGLSLHRAGPG